MKIFLSSLVATAFLATPAMACGMKSAETKTMTTAEAPVASEEAMSTYDPTTKPAFEIEAEKIEPVADEKAAD